MRPGDEQAITEGKKIYDRWCRSCHLADGSGRIGPNLNDDQWNYPRTATDQGKFEIIYAGGAGAMPAFGNRLERLGSHPPARGVARDPAHPHHRPHGARDGDRS